ncbi:hypothetical protein ACVWZK_006428 [Bradyrhizobium sp. GM0.4]
MARIRTIKPELPQSQSIGRLSRDARLLFIQLFTIADDAGRARAASRLLASLLYPYDDDAPTLIEGWLDELAQQKQIRRYVVDGSEYLEIVKWLEHQKIDRPSASRLPAFCEGSPEPREDSRGLDADLGPVPVPRKGEGGDADARSRSDLKIVGEEGKPKRIDENYQPSDRMIEYAYSLGMKKVDLNSELSKFAADGLAFRKVSFDLDASFKKWCDYWLDFKRRKDPNWKPEAEKPEATTMASTVWIDEGTLEWSAHQSDLHRTTGRGSPVADHKDENGARTGRRGWYFKSLWPAGFNDFGERIEPASEDAA